MLPQVRQAFFVLLFMILVVSATSRKAISYHYGIKPIHGWIMQEDLFSLTIKDLINSSTTICMPFFI
jgi:hypothetical protein